jgi:hypothetical protein
LIFNQEYLQSKYDNAQIETITSPSAEGEVDEKPSKKLVADDNFFYDLLTNRCDLNENNFHNLENATFASIIFSNDMSGDGKNFDLATKGQAKDFIMPNYLQKGTNFRGCVFDNVDFSNISDDVFKSFEFHDKCVFIGKVKFKFEGVSYELEGEDFTKCVSNGQMRSEYIHEMKEVAYIDFVEGDRRGNLSQKEIAVHKKQHALLKKPNTRISPTNYESLCDMQARTITGRA